MKRTALIVAAVVVAALGGGAAWWFSQGTEAPSVDVTAPPVETTTTAEVSTPDSTEAESGGAVTYALTEQTRAVFTIDEELRGNPATVEGVSTIVLGEMVLDPADPSSLQLGTILVNARDFTTDSGNRNRAVRGPILDANTFEFIQFAPTTIEGIDGAGGTEVSFTVTGDLTIRDVTNPVTFDVTASVGADSTVAGTATATIDRTDWGISIPSAPGVANVSEEVDLRLEFVAAPTA